MTCCGARAASLSRRHSSSASQGIPMMPFANVTNTPASRASAAATPASQDDSRLASGIQSIPKAVRSSGDASRRRSQGLENLQEQLQGVMMEGNQIQVGHVTPAAVPAAPYSLRWILQMWSCMFLYCQSLLVIPKVCILSFVCDT